MNLRNPKKGELGHIEQTKVSRQKGGGRVKGRANIDFDSHALAYLLRGINDEIAKYEKMIASGNPLDAEDQKAYDYNQYLRDTLESIRNETLEE